MSGLIVGGTARVKVGVKGITDAVLLIGAVSRAGTVLRPDGVKGIVKGVVITIRLRLVEGLYGPSETTITSFVGRYKGLLARVELSAVSGRARLVAAVGSGRAGVPRCRAVAARRALGAAVGIPAAVRAGKDCRDQASVWRPAAGRAVVFIYLFIYLIYLLLVAAYSLLHTPVTKNIRPLRSVIVFSLGGFCLASR